MVLNQLADSDHKPIQLDYNMNYLPIKNKFLPRWNYKRADWDSYKLLTDQYCENVPERHGKMKDIIKCLNTAILKAAIETIPRGARSNYRPYWTDDLQELEDELHKARQNAEKEQSSEANIKLKATAEKYKRTLNTNTRNSWREKTESLNLDRDGNKLWRLVKTLNN
jgi:hypothetical protein